MDIWWPLIFIGLLLLGINILLLVRTRRLSNTAIATDKVIDDTALINKRLLVGITEFEKTMQTMIVSSLPRDGFPHQIEACWEDVGARGRFLTDLGGMSIGMREQMFEEFVRALNKPMPTAPAAGSFNDVMLGMDEWLTKQTKQDKDEFVIVRRDRR